MEIRKTKVVATIGPASDDPKILESMLEAGMDVARLNLSHGTLEEHDARRASSTRSAWAGRFPIDGRGRLRKCGEKPDVRAVWTRGGEALGS